MKYKNILVLAPHTDDAELGCGGTMARFLEEGTEVHVAAFSIATDSLPEGVPSNTLELELLQSMSVMGIKPPNVHVYNFQVRKLSDRRQDILDELIRLRRIIHPDLVLLPSSHDVHQDHQVIYAEGVRAFKETSVFGYELPWNQLQSSVPALIVLEKRHVDRKWEALQSYKSQLTLNRSYFTEQFISGLASVRGTQMKAEYAEAYEVVRMIL